MSVPRVTQTSMSNSALRGLQGSLTRTQRLQEQLSSGRRVSRPGDDPTATGAAMNLRSQRRADEQYLRNSDDASGRLAITDQALTELSDRIRKVRELTVYAGNAAVSTDGRVAIAAEITAIGDEVRDLYNTRWLGRPIFGGTIQGSAAVDGTGTYVGDDQPVTARISRDAVLRVDVKGSDAAANTLPAILSKIASDVTGNLGAVSADLDVIDAEFTKVLRCLGDIGARAARLDTAKANVDSERLDFTARISENEDIDLPETIMKLQSQQVAYQSALGAAAKILQVSLVDYLR